VNTLIEISAVLKDKLNQLPQLPGVYKMLDSKGNIIYIGKSKCLKKRVKTYFTDRQEWGKIKKLVFLIDDIDYIVTDTHLEARLLECELIKEIKPAFNSQMKNDRKYVYLKLENYNKFKALSVVSDREEYTYGPFRQKYSLCSIIDSLKCIFPINKKNSSYELDYHIIPLSMDQEAFDKNRKNLIELFSDSKSMSILINALEDKMEEAAALYKYETASKYRDIIQGFNYINNGIWHYRKLMSQDILLKIPTTQGYKLFFISNGNMLLKKNYDNPTSKDIDLFIDSAYSIKPSISIDMDEKTGIDFRDILYSEIISLPEEMIMYTNMARLDEIATEEDDES
jgi:excinuclease ABC subunit C